ncbi:MAG: ATP-binding cassette domain-containing protein [Eubacteriales bacterium]|nr:ATP-binding cassette domain-containing protein [Eubacteriales bacterium]
MSGIDSALQESAIIANRMSLRYRDGTEALKSADLEIKTGELVFITGPSGSGKTSLLKLFMGMEYPTEGTLTVMGTRVDKNTCSRKIMALRREIGPVFQDFRLIDGSSALQNITTGMRFLGVRKKIMKELALEALERTGLADKADTPAENLSWGERQRVAIARAAARDPKLILADEPTGNLDRHNAVNIIELLASYRNMNTTVIITTHATHLIEGFENSVRLTLESGILGRREGGDQA